MQKETFTDQDEANRRTYGYARVSTEDQSLKMQMDALNNVPCFMIYSEKKSAAAPRRHQFELLRMNLRRGDTLVVWKLDRLGRDLTGLSKLLADFEEQGIEFRSLTESIDTSTAMGRMFFHLTAAFAELERNLTRERTRAGMDAAKLRGVVFGRPTGIVGDKREAILADIQDLSLRMTEVADKHGVSTTTLAKHFPRERQKALARLGR